jgi:type I restriction enzyme S subunit
MNEASDLPRLPQGWVWTRLIDACQYVPTGVPAFEGKIEYYSTGSIGKDCCAPEGTYSFTKRPSRANRIAQEGDVLQARMRETNKALLIGNKFSGKLFSTGFFQVRPFDCSLGMAPYLYFYVQSSDFLRQRDTLATGSTQVALTDSAAQRIYFPLAPLEEQHQIVAKIEELFTRLNAGVEALNKIKAQLKRYRQSVLKHAFEGKLTEEWRQIHKDELEPASVLLERIKQECQKTSKSKYKELPPLDSLDLIELPEGWAWTRVENVSETIQYGTSEKANGDSSGIPVIRMGNIKDGKLVLDELKYFPQGWPQLDDFILQEGDVLFNRTNSADLVGKTAVYKNFHPRAVFASYLIRVRVNKAYYSADMLSFFINSLYGRRYIASVVSQQVGQANVNGTKLSLMPIPVPPLIEQDRLVAEIERHFSVADEIEKTVDQSLKQAGRLCQSILKCAFEGKLAPQDPNDEPAEKLLERIKAEKAKRLAEDHSRRKNRTGGATKQMRLM